MPADFARTQAQIAARTPWTAPGAPRSTEVAPDPTPALRSRQNGAQGHDRPGMIPRDPLEPDADNLRNMED